IVPAPEEELVAHRVGECLAELDRQRVPGGLAPLLRAFLARRIAQGDLAAGLFGQEALVMDAARDQASGLVSHPRLLRDAVAIAPRSLPRYTSVIVMGAISSRSVASTSTGRRVLPPR